MENSNQYFSDIVYTDIFPNLLTIYNTRLFNAILIRYPTHPRQRFQIRLFFMQKPITQIIPVPLLIQ